jgi:CheY-like chemotaxis protein
MRIYTYVYVPGCIQMPIKDGPTATAELRAKGYTGAIFGVTGNGMASDVEYFLSSGADKV